MSILPPILSIFGLFLSILGFFAQKRKGLKILFFYKVLISAWSSFSEMIISEYGVGHNHSFENDLGEQVKSVSGENLPEQI